jgi:hypothetical protein
MARDAPISFVSYRTPRLTRVSEFFAFVLYFVVLGAVFSLLLWLSCYLIFVLVGWNWGGAPAAVLVPLFFCCVLLGLGSAFWLARVRLWWSIRLDETGAQLGGRWIGKHVGHAEIALIHAGGLLWEVRRTKTLASLKALRQSGTVVRLGAMPLALLLSGRRRYYIWLRPADLQRCFTQLLARCPGAAGIGLDGSEHFPEDVSALARALRKVGGVRRTAGWVGLAMSAVLLHRGAVAALAMLLGRAPANWMVQAGAWLELLQLPSGIIGVLASVALLRRGRFFRKAARRLKRDDWHQETQ